MGSGELTATMVGVHKELIARLGGSPKAVFLDTPAGFQLNADQLAQRAVEYFYVNVGHPMTAVSLKSKDISAVEAEQAFSSLKDSDYILVGPGSPTYAVRQWRETPVPGIIERRLEQGACFVAASAAALTIGRFTLPVYEIYKVGQDPHWVDGLNILGCFGLNMVVIPHWNNAEGGTHDTRFCFMGEARFGSLQSMLPEDVGVLGIDEHTACIVDLDREEFTIKGLGTVTLRRGTFEKRFTREGKFPLRELSEDPNGAVAAAPQCGMKTAAREPVTEDEEFWRSVHALEAAFHKGLDGDARDATNAVLDLDGLVWQAHQDKQDPGAVSQAREFLREFIVLLGTRLASAPGSCQECLEPLVEELLALRALFRRNNKWQEADEVRDCLRRARIEVEDTKEGSRWRLES